MLRTPVAFIIFNRPDTTQRVFEAIRQAQPSKLLVIADGPRQDRLGEAEKCDAVRAIVEQVDWECQVFKNYSEVNLGCKRRVASGLDWVFETVEEAIILEDDCLPHPTFFRFCEELLEYYRDDKRVMTISGNNFQFGRNSTEYSYYFSRYNHIWGWATWRRAWKYYDVTMKAWESLRETNWLYSFLGNQLVAKHWHRVFQQAFEGRIDTWDYAWTFTCWSQNALSILPRVNLVSNIGFGLEATHTKEAQSQFSNMPTFRLDFPLRYPELMIKNFDADRFTESIMFSLTWSLRLKIKFERALKKIRKFTLIG